MACDQFTSQPEYWKETEAIVGDAPSTLNLMLPELYLGSDEEPAKIETIRNAMKAYLEDGTMIVVENGYKFIGRRLQLIVTSILQTAAGRMVFARPKFGKDGNPIEID